MIDIGNEKVISETSVGGNYTRAGHVNRQKSYEKSIKLLTRELKESTKESLKDIVF